MFIMCMSSTCSSRFFTEIAEIALWGYGIPPECCVLPSSRFILRLDGGARLLLDLFEAISRIWFRELVDIYTEYFLDSWHNYNILISIIFFSPLSQRIETCFIPRSIASILLCFLLASLLLSMFSPYQFYSLLSDHCIS